MNDIKIKEILEEIKVNYEPKEFEEISIWLDGLLQSEVAE